MNNTNMPLNLEIKKAILKSWVEILKYKNILSDDKYQKMIIKIANLKE